jgi:hypothetical protein
MANDFLLKVADVLDALANEKSKLASELAKVKTEQRKANLSPVLDKLSFATGEDPDKLESKLAGVSDDVLNIIKGITTGEPASLGGPGRNKTAGVELSNRDFASVADKDFASWLLNS